MSAAINRKRAFRAELNAVSDCWASSRCAPDATIVTRADGYRLIGSKKVDCSVILPLGLARDTTTQPDANKQTVQAAPKMHSHSFPSTAFSAQCGPSVHPQVDGGFRHRCLTQSRGAGRARAGRPVGQMCLAPSGAHGSAGVLACEFGRRLAAGCVNRARTPYSLAAETAALR